MQYTPNIAQCGGSISESVGSGFRGRVAHILNVVFAVSEATAVAEDASLVC